DRAVIAGALVGDALGDRLGALEASRGIELRALATGVKLGLAVRAARERLGRDRQYSAAFGAARGRGALEDSERAGGLRGLAARRPRRWSSAAPSARRARPAPWRGAR